MDCLYFYLNGPSFLLKKEAGMDIKEMMGQRIKSLRQANNMTQEELSEKAGITAKYLSSIERGHENPTLDTLIHIAGALGVDLSDLFQYAHESSDSKYLRDHIAEIIKHADSDRLRIAVKLLRALFY